MLAVGWAFSFPTVKALFRLNSLHKHTDMEFAAEVTLVVVAVVFAAGLRNVAAAAAGKKKNRYPVVKNDPDNILIRVQLAGRCCRWAGHPWSSNYVHKHLCSHSVVAL